MQSRFWREGKDIEVSLSALVPSVVNYLSVNIEEYRGRAGSGGLELVSD